MIVEETLCSIPFTSVKLMVYLSILLLLDLPIGSSKNIQLKKMKYP